MNRESRVIRNKKPFYKKWWVWLIGMFLILMIINPLNPKLQKKVPNKPFLELNSSNEYKPAGDGYYWMYHISFSLPRETYYKIDDNEYSQNPTTKKGTGNMKEELLEYSNGLSDNSNINEAYMNSGTVKITYWKKGSSTKYIKRIKLKKPTKKQTLKQQGIVKKLDNESPQVKQNNNNSQSTESNSMNNDKTTISSMTVYGELSLSDVNENKLGDFTEKSPLNYVHISAPNNIIKSVRLDLIKTPILLSDTESLKEYYSEYMEKDSQQIESLNDTDFVFHSNKIDKDYEVKYQANTEGELDGKVSVKQIFISEYS